MTFSDDPDALRDAFLLPYTGDTHRTYSYWLDRYLVWCAGERLSPLHVTRRDVERYVSHLVGIGLKPASVLTGMKPVQGLYRLAHVDGKLSRDPSVHLKLPQASRGESTAVGLDRDQLRAFLAAGADMGGRHHAAAYLLGCMALRASEACSLQVEDYANTVRGHRVLEFTGKGRVPARMPLPEPVVPALDAAAADRPTGPILLRPEGLPHARSHLYNVVRAVGRRAGISHAVSSHSLRHSAITNALESGAPLHKVQDLARHQQPRTTMRYDRNRSNLDSHAVHTLVSFVAPPTLDLPADRIGEPS